MTTPRNPIKHRVATLCRWSLVATGFAVSLLTGASDANALLAYNLPSELKKTHCINDTDNDCLDNNEEGNLALALAPIQFYDEDEDCSGWTNKWGVPSTHFKRRDYFQVRPRDLDGIQHWSATDGKKKWVQVTYFLLYPHDCQSYLGFGGHQGDSEHVRYSLYSYNLKQWYLSSARYWHHGSNHVISGSTIANRAAQLGAFANSTSVTRPTVASDEDGHGSWPGYKINSSDCAGSEDNSTNDCFIDDWEDDYINHHWEYVQATRNIGGRAPEIWNASMVVVSGSAAYTSLNVGHGSNREYWSPRLDKYKYFCGWECAANERQSDGHCSATRHDEDCCAEGPLASKVDTTPFAFTKPPPPTSCNSYCGSYTGLCGCSVFCTLSGDCCPDYTLVCLEEPCLMVFADDAGLPILVVTPCQAGATGGPADAAARAVPLVEAASRELRRQAAEQSDLLERERLLYLASDPIVSVLPMLAGTTPTQQLRTLKWMLRFADARQWISLFPDLEVSIGHAPSEATLQEATDRLMDLVALLEVNGYTSPDLGEDFVVAEIVEEGKLEQP